MKKTIILFLIILLSGLSFIMSSCTKSIEPDEETLSISFPMLNKKHDLYFHLDHNARSIEILFNENIDQSTIDDNIELSDKDGSLNPKFDIEVYGKIVTLRFHQDYILNDGWKYFLIITTGLKSINGTSLKYDETFELRTTGELIGLTDYR